MSFFNRNHYELLGNVSSVQPLIAKTSKAIKPVGKVFLFIEKTETIEPVLFRYCPRGIVCPIPTRIYLMEQIIQYRILFPQSNQPNVSMPLVPNSLC